MAVALFISKACARRSVLRGERAVSAASPWPPAAGTVDLARLLNTSSSMHAIIVPGFPSIASHILLHGRTYPSPVFIYPHLHCSPRHTSTPMALSHGLLFCISANPHTPVMHHLLYTHLSLSVLEGICIHRRCYCFGHNFQDTNLSVTLLAVLVIFLAWARCLSKYIHMQSGGNPSQSAKKVPLIVQSTHVSKAL
ncbi:hypothetical protein C8Q76DRAFT_438953 [Earliella scabrosa]|nr:hypothetical protein C8Q76DRAFT_438953 [Earliella scabrosa]